MLVFRGLALLVLNGLTLAPFPDNYLALSTGFVTDFIGTVEFFGKKINLTCLKMCIRDSSR